MFTCLCTWIGRSFGGHGAIGHEIHRKKGFPLIRFASRYIKPYRWQFILGSLSKLMEAMLELCLPLLMAQIIDTGIPAGDTGYILKRGLYLVLLILSSVGFALYCQYSAAAVSQGVGTAIRNAMMEKIQRLSFGELDRFAPSTLINRTTSDVNYVQQAVAMTMRLLTRAPFLCLGALLMALRIDKQLTLVFLVVIPFLSLAIFILIRITSPLYGHSQKKLDTVSLVVRENLSGVRDIRAFSRTAHETQRFEQATETLRKETVHVSMLSALMQPTTSLIMNAGILAILYFGASRVYGGHLSRGDVFALTSYATTILYALVVVSNLVVLFTKAAASTARIEEILNVSPSIAFPDQTRGKEKQDAPVFRFDHVSFSYNGKEDALTDVSMEAARGEMLGIVGITGSGKSTLTHLLQRFYDPTAGSVSIAGLDAKAYAEGDLRAHFSIVPQKSLLFSGTIAENLRWGKQDATEADMLEALRIAQALDFVSNLSQGLDTPIQEGGKNFSGGQRQRLCIARAVVAKPDVLILDDSLSALDYKTDLALRRCLRSDLDSTVVIISQRISSVMHADRIVVLSEGEVEGVGTHAHLLAHSDTYREIYETQTESAQDRGGANA